MQSLKNLFANIYRKSTGVKRSYAQVHDIQIKVGEKVLGSMERNGM